MSNCFTRKSETERYLAKSLRAAVEAEIQHLGWNDAAVAERLGIAPVGWEITKARVWDLSDAVSVADAIGLKLYIVVE
jgi:hypothetical protein